MKFLIGIISGIVISAAGIAGVATSGASESAVAVQQGALMPQAPLALKGQQRPLARAQGTRSLVGELKREDDGTLELEVQVRRNGELDDQDVRVLAGRARIVGRLGGAVALPADGATVRVIGWMPPAARWIRDADGRPVPTIRAIRISVLATPQMDGEDPSD